MSRFLVAIAVAEHGFREVIGAMEGAKEDKDSWSAFVKHLKERGLNGVQLVIRDNCLSLVESIAEIFPAARGQRCVIQFYRNPFTIVLKGKVREVTAMRKAIDRLPDDYYRRRCEVVATTYFWERAVDWLRATLKAVTPLRLGRTPT